MSAVVFFVKQKTAYELRISDWSSDVCSSDLARGWGRIVNIASVTFYGGWALLSPYVASKGALVGLTRAWAREFGPDGVTVNAIAPGAFPTDAEKNHHDPRCETHFVSDHQEATPRAPPTHTPKPPPSPTT